jgi:hypothetical protein
MTEVAVHFARDHMDAEVAVSALRAARLHPRIALDNSLGGSLTSNTGRRVIFVPVAEEERAREVLDEEAPQETEDNPVLRLAVIVALIVGLLLATPFVAQVCSRPSG